MRKLLLAFLLVGCLPSFAAHNHIVVVFVENHSYEGPTGFPSTSTHGPVGNPEAQYYNNVLIHNYSLIDNAFANGHDSLRQYGWLLFGTPNCVAAQPTTVTCRGNPSSLVATANNWVSSAIAAGKTWKGYAEGIPSRGYIVENSGVASVNPTGSTYYPRHAPEVYVNEVRQSITTSGTSGITDFTHPVDCSGHIHSAPLVVGYDSIVQACNVVNFQDSLDGFITDLNNKALPNLSLVTPDGCNQAHDCPNLATGTGGGQIGLDNWLKLFIDPFLHSCYFTGIGCTADGMLLIWWDEGLVGSSSSTNYVGRCQGTNGTLFEDDRLSSTVCGTFGGNNGGGRAADIIAAANLATPGSHYTAAADLLHPTFTRLVLDELGLSLSGYPVGVTGVASISNIFVKGASIQGFVHKLSDSSPIIGASVTANGVSGVTDSLGNYFLQSVPAGVFTVSASAAGFQTQTTSPITVTDGQTSQVNFALTATGGGGGTVTGQVTSSGLALSGVTVSAPSASAVTDVNGNYSIPNVTAGTITLTAAKTGYITGTLTNVVVNNGLTTSGQNFSLTLAPTGGTLTGVVTSQFDGSVISSATVSTPNASVVTGADGRYSVPNVPAGNVTVSVSASGFLSQSTVAVIVDSKTTTQDFVLTQSSNSQPTPGLIALQGMTIKGMTLGVQNTCSGCAPPPGSISGIVSRASDGTPINLASVISGGTTVLTDSTGNFSISGIAPGNVAISVAASGFITQSSTVAVFTGQTTTANFSLISSCATGCGTTGSISGTVTKLVGGAAISGATVSISSGSAVTDGSGNYTLSNVVPGTYTVSASAAGFTSLGKSGIVVTGGNTTSGVNFALVACTGSCSGTVFNPNTTISEQRDNNTSACGSGLDANHAPSVGPTSCQAAFPGATQNAYPITSISRSGTTVTVSISGAKYFSNLSKVTISGVSNISSFPNGTYQVTAATSSTIQYTQSGSAVSSSGGTATRATQTGTYHAAPANVANFANDGVDVHDLIYSTSGGKSTAKVLFHYQGWFGCTGTCQFTQDIPNPPGVTTFNGHLLTGYVTNNVNQVTAQMNAMKRLNGDGVIKDWYGPPFASANTNRKADDAVVQKWRDAIGAVGDSFSFVLQLDAGTFNTSNTCGTSNQTPSCVEKYIDCALDYANRSTSFTCLGSGETFTGQAYFSHPHYLKNSGHPLFGFFISESSFFMQCTTTAPCVTYNNGGTAGSCTSSSSCWGLVYVGMQKHVASYSAVPYFYHRNTFAHAQPNNGSFKWLNPSTDDTFWDEVAKSGISAGYDSWLASAATSTLPIIMAVGYKGFDLANSGFSHAPNDNRLIGQSCGMTWVRTLGEPNDQNEFSSTHQLPYLQIQTWDDYDEGTGVEMGISSCYSISASIASSTVSYTLATSNSVQAPLSPINPTLHHFAVYVTKDGTNAMQLGPNLPVVSSGTIDLSQFHLEAGNYTAYIKMVGVTDIQNSLSAPMSYTAP